MKKRFFFLHFFCLILSLSAQSYTPIVLVHGVLSDDCGMKPTEHYIRKYMGNEVYIKNIQLGIGHLTSLTNVYHQVGHLRKEIQSDPELQHGFNFVVHSQGGLVARYYLQKYNNPPVLTYISWGSPQQGVFGLPGTIDKKFKWLDYLEGYAHLILFNWTFQKCVSFAGYWHDTLHYDLYLKKSCFLPFINNDITHADSSLFKNNICSLKNMVLVMSVNEHIVEPRESCHFGFYKPGTRQLQNVFETDLYTQDRLGLKTLHQTGRLHLRYAECSHAQFQEDERNFVENTLAFLKADLEP